MRLEKIVNSYNLQSHYILTEWPVNLAISVSLLNTPGTVRGGGVNIVRWVVRLPSATKPRSPFSATSALICWGLRPKE